MQAEFVQLLKDKDEVRLEGQNLEEARKYFRSRFLALLNDHVRSHPLGFLYASEKIDHQTDLRYHLWLNDWQMPTLEEGKEDHDHTYRLTSLVLAGKLRHRTFVAVDDKQGDREVFTVSYQSGNSTLLPTGRLVRIQTASDNVYHAGQSYVLVPGTIHRVVPVKLPLATMVLTISGINSGTPRVFGGVNQIVGPLTFRREVVTDKQKRAVIAALSEI